MPALVARHGAELHDFNLIAHAAFVHGIMSRELFAAPHILLEQRMLHQRFNAHDDGLVVLVADNDTGEGSALAISRACMVQPLYSFSVKTVEMRAT